MEAVEKLEVGVGYFIYSVEQVEHSTLLEDLKLDRSKKYAVILGNEVKGVPAECGGCVRPAASKSRNTAPNSLNLRDSWHYHLELL